jgi:hypothetical protein
LPHWPSLKVFDSIGEHRFKKTCPMGIMGTTLEPFKNFGGVSVNVNKLISGFNMRIFRKFAG